MVPLYPTRLLLRELRRVLLNPVEVSPLYCRLYYIPVGGRVSDSVVGDGVVVVYPNEVLETFEVKTS